MDTGNIIVVGGKGGVGKTSTSTLLAQIIAASGCKLLFIDADPAISAAYTLGYTPKNTLGNYREFLIENPEDAAQAWQQKTRTLIEGLIEDTGLGFDILCMGKAEAQGCFCGVNDLLCFGIETVCKDYDWVLIDCEAGLEQVNRRAVHHIDKLVLVTDTSMRGVETLDQMMKVANKLNRGRPFAAYVISNRVRSDADRMRMDKAIKGIGLDVSVFVPENQEILDRNSNGEPLVGLSENDEAYAVLNSFAKNKLLV